jgi:hypothetical protein
MNCRIFDSGKFPLRWKGARMIAEKRAVQKEKRYWLEDWFTEQEESAFDKREKAVKKYKAKLKELNGELPK